MKILAIGKTKVELYNSIKELPISASKKMHSFILQESGIGNTIQDIDSRLERLMLFLTAGNNPEALEEAKNLRFALFSTISQMSFESAAFGCLVKSVNDKENTDYSQEGLQNLVAQLSKAGLSAGMVTDILEDVKKNLIPNENFASLPFTSKI
jgi:hypothetical protein